MASFLEELEAEHAQLADDTCEIPVPPSGRRVVVCKVPTKTVKGKTVPDTDLVDAIVLAYRTRGALSYDETLQLFVDVCDEIKIRDPATGELQEVDGGPLRFDDSDERWGEDVDSARECVAKLFHLDVKPMAASGAAAYIVDWMQTASAAALKRVEGKSGDGES